ncbi:hypothetical protein RFI_06734 [Reticulomyxa filosa]|uniref:Uncharacterized protein n=1 Tax=Reticulomyxa filosa TaxID=46433 RepID=X6NX10_RETFI|nr:hypothetical protein RFI_06734 [Reticulomyxa filosa]|eukprot:ETO30388.1 hypothetical protein RFI_06734 [Reticulomyxa filosa]
MSQKTQPPDAADEEIFREVREEIAREEAEQEKQKQEMMANGTFLKPNETIQNGTMNGQLTTFQEAIVTTGSEVSVILLVVLAILFVIQAIRKAYNHIITQRELEKVDSVLDDGIPVNAEAFTPISDLDPRSYPVYNTNLVEKEEYLKNVAENAPITTLKEILLKRAIVCIDRVTTIQRDEQGIRKNWSMDMLPRDVWDDFNAAQMTIREEINDVLKENAEKSFQWGKYGNDIFARAKEVFGEHVNRKKMEWSQKMRQQGLVPPGQMPMPMSMPMDPIINTAPHSDTLPNGQPSQAPNSKEFGV